MYVDISILRIRAGGHPVNAPKCRGSKLPLLLYPPTIYTFCYNARGIQITTVRVEPLCILNTGMLYYDNNTIIVVAPRSATAVAGHNRINGKCYPPSSDVPERLSYSVIRTHSRCATHQSDEPSTKCSINLEVLLYYCINSYSCRAIINPEYDSSLLWSSTASAAFFLASRHRLDGNGSRT